MWKHVLVEDYKLDNLLQHNAARIKCTCFSVSENYIALGTNSGIVTIYSRKSQTQVQVILSEKNAGMVVAVEFAGEEKYIGYATSNGHCFIFDIKANQMCKPERLRVSLEHKGHSVTYLSWDSSSSKLFIGDGDGWVSVLQNSVSKAKDIFQQPSHVILKLDSEVVQIDWMQERLLVSTMSRSYLCHISREQYTQIGKKLRDGPFGNCFIDHKSSQDAIIYCARPGSRLWEVDFEGNVINTHQLKDQLSVPSFPVLSTRMECVSLPSTSAVDGNQSVNFNLLQPFLSNYILSYTKNGLYIIDPQAGELVTWTSDFKGATSVKCKNNTVFVFSHENKYLRGLSLLSPIQCLAAMISSHNWKLACIISCYFDSIFLEDLLFKYVSPDTLDKFNDAITDIEELNPYKEKIASLVDLAKGRYINEIKSQKVFNELTYGNSKRGIVVVNDGSNSYEMQLINKRTNLNLNLSRSVMATSSSVELATSENALSTKNNKLSSSPTSSGTLSPIFTPTTLPYSNDDLLNKFDQLPSNLPSHVNANSVSSPSEVWDRFSMSSLIENFSVAKQKIETKGDLSTYRFSQLTSKFWRNIKAKSLSSSSESLVSNLSNEITNENPTKPTKDIDKADVASLSSSSWDGELLLELTRSTYRIIRDHKVLFDQKSMVDCLTVWLGHLHKAVSSYQDALLQKEEIVCTCHDGLNSYSSSDSSMKPAQKKSPKTQFNLLSEQTEDSHDLKVGLNEQSSQISPDSGYQDGGELMNEKLNAQCSKCNYNLLNFFKFENGECRTYFKGLLPLSGQLLDFISELMSTCYRLRIHADIIQALFPNIGIKIYNSDIIDINPESSSVWSSVELNEGNSNSEHYQVESENTIKVLQENPENYSNVLSEERQLCLLTWVYFDLLKPHTVMECIINWQLDTFPLWRTYFYCLEGYFKERHNIKGVNSSKLSKKLTSNQEHPLHVHENLFILVRMFSSQPQECVEFCIADGCKTHPLHISYMCQLYGFSQEHWLLYYLSRMTTVQLLSNNWIERDKLRDSVLSTLLSENMENKCIGTSSRYKNEICEEHKTLLNFILDYSVDKKRDMERTYDQCHSYRYIPGCVKLLNALRRREEMFQLIIKNNFLELLLQDHIAPITTDEWLKILNLKVLEDSSRTVSHDQRESWTYLIQLILDLNSEENALQILLSSGIDVMESNLEVFQNMLSRFTIKQEQRLVIHSLLDKLNAFLWTKKSTLSIKKATEGSEENSSSGAYMTGVWCSSSDVLGDCSACGVSLTESATVTFHNIIICNCGSVYHKTCLSHLVFCPMCLLK